MSFETLKQWLVALVREHDWLAGPVCFFLGFGEGIPVLSLLLPSSALFLGIGAVHGAAGGVFWTTWLWASIGAILGDCVTYAIGRVFKDQSVSIWPFSKRPEWLIQSRVMIRDWGALSVLGGKFLGLLRPFIPVVAGMFVMPLWKFVPASVLSSITWAGVFLGPGYGLAWLTL